MTQLLDGEKGLRDEPPQPRCRMCAAWQICGVSCLESRTLTPGSILFESLEGFSAPLVPGVDHVQDNKVDLSAMFLENRQRVGSAAQQEGVSVPDRVSTSFGDDQPPCPRPPPASRVSFLSRPGRGMRCVSSPPGTEAGSNTWNVDPRPSPRSAPGDTSHGRSAPCRILEDRPRTRIGPTGLRGGGQPARDGAPAVLT